MSTPEQRAKNIALLREHWQLALPGETLPSDRQMSLWLLLHDDDVQRITYAFNQTARKLATCPRMAGDANFQLRFASSVMNKFKFGKAA